MPTTEINLLKSSQGVNSIGGNFRFLFLFMFLFVYIFFVCLFICLFIYLSVYLFVCVFVFARDVVVPSIPEDICPLVETI